MHIRIGYHVLQPAKEESSKYLHNSYVLNFMVLATYAWYIASWRISNYCLADDLCSEFCQVDLKEVICIMLMFVPYCIWHPIRV